MNVCVDLNFSRGAYQLDAKFECSAKKVIGVEGAMGAGKSTLFHCMAGLLRSKNGYFSIGDFIYQDSKKKIFQSSQKRNLGYLFQESHLFSHLSVEENLYFSSSKKTKKENFYEIVDLLQLSLLLKKRAHQLSGGEARRLALGRVFLSNFHFLLLDEPFIYLEENQSLEIIAYLQRKLEETSIFFTSHQTRLFDALAEERIKCFKGTVRKV